MKDIIIIGGGAAGIFAAIGAKLSGANVTIIEKNNKLGKKLAITGKGRCNLTNIADIDVFLNNFSSNCSFIYSPFYSFSNQNLIEFLEKIGIPTKVERGGRVFPQNDSALQVVNTLRDYLKKIGVKIIYNTKIKDLKLNNNKVCGVIANNDFFPADKIILATGGLSYPLTGSTGDGYKIAEKLGHNIKHLYPVLVPLEVKEKWAKDLTGLSLKNVTVSVKNKNKILSEFGEMLFTHFGVSGPIILTLSKYIVEMIDDGVKNLKIEINLKPALNVEKLNKRVLRDLEKNANKQLKNSLGDLLPKALISVIINLSKIFPEKYCNQVTKEERIRLVHLLQHLPLTVIKARPIDEAIITAGGIDIKEINPTNMESKLIKDLYFAGEVLDLDANTGGYNLQFAFSTGYLAGQSAAKN